MNHRRTLASALYFASVFLTWRAFAAPCEAETSQHIPPRASAAPGGQAFARQVAEMTEDEREAAIYTQLMAGNVPTFLRRRLPVQLSAEQTDGSVVEATVCVAPDYLAIGSDSDYLFVPMRLGTALAVAARYGDVLPTRRLVDAIYAQAPVHLAPQPLPASDAMRTTAYYWHHNQEVRQQRSLFAAALGTLTAGDKKDLVLSNRLWNFPGRVAIYGWHEPDGQAIQPLSTVHGARYADYSHGVRMISNIAYIGGVARPLLKLLTDPEAANLFSDEGAIPKLGELLTRLTQPRDAFGLIPTTASGSDTAR